MPSEVKRVMVIAAHPDDEVLGCGATIAKEIANGSEVRVIIMADGITARYETVSEEAERELQTLYTTSCEALKVLGVPNENILYCRYADMKMNTIPFIDLVLRIRKETQAFKPSVVYTHHRGDYNVDHRVVFDVVIAATRPCPHEHTPQQLYAFEVNSSTEWASPLINPFAPTVYVNVEQTIEKKMAALLRYTTEVRDYPHPRSPDGVEILAKKRGLDVGMRYAEAFELIREIRS